MIFLSILIILVAIALPSYNKNLSSILITRISAIIFIYSAVLSFITLLKSQDGSSSFLNSLSLYKNNSNNLQLLQNNSKSSLSLYNLSELQKINIIGFYVPKTEYCLIILFSLLGSSLLISSSDLLSMYISIELQSFSLYILATLYKDYESSTASGLKYFLLGALSSCFILLGSGLIYTFTGLTNFESIYSLISSVSSSYIYFADLNNINLDITQSYNIISGVSLGIILIFIGFLFKISAAPLHS